MTNKAMYTAAGLGDSEANNRTIVDGAWRKIVAKDGGKCGVRKILHVRGSRYQQ